MDIPVDKLPKQKHEKLIYKETTEKGKTKEIKIVNSLDKALSESYLKLYFDNIKYNETNNNTPKKKN